jgi:hypothetical protein
MLFKQGLKFSTVQHTETNISAEIDVTSGEEQ